MTQNETGTTDPPIWIEFVYLMRLKMEIAKGSYIYGKLYNSLFPVSQIHHIAALSVLAFSIGSSHIGTVERTMYICCGNWYSRLTVNASTKSWSWEESLYKYALKKDIYLHFLKDWLMICSQLKMLSTSYTGCPLAGIKGGLWGFVILSAIVIGQ